MEAPSRPPAVAGAQPSLHGSRTELKEYQRAYKACIPCRKRKAKCELSVKGSLSGPPCARCRREHRECIFSPERNWNSKRAKLGSAATASVSAGHFGALPLLPGIHKEVEAHPHNHVPLSSPLSSSDGRTSGHTPRGSLGDSVMRTVVSSGNDALNILFEAASHQEDNAAGDSEAVGPSSLQRVRPGSPLSANPAHLHPIKLSPTSRQIHQLWSRCRFVKQGWISAEEAVTYVDLFFKNMCPLSPIITDYYGLHENHHQLITQEPTLCSTILMISSRYHVLPGNGGVSRSYFIHDRLWKHCQQLIIRTVFGQEKTSEAKTRTIGTIEALLLISEWHPRSLHFPPENEGWDADLIPEDPSNGYLDEIDGQQGVKPPKSTRWLEDVMEPAQRSDRMSWMLLGSALTLAYELGIFDEEKLQETSTTPVDQDDANKASVRRMRARKLLYVYINELASRLGHTSPIPQSMKQIVMAGSVPKSATDAQWQSHMVSWIELTKLVKSVSAMFFPSPSFTRQLLHSGRYVSLLEHFLPLLEQWREKHIDSHSYQACYQETLFIEYNYVRIYINSLGMQAVCERALSEMDSENDQEALLRTSVDEVEYGFIQEVVDGSCQILEKVISLAKTDTLRFSPVRIFLRITTSSIFLLKAISLGVRSAKLQSSLDILDRSIQALKSSQLDDIHLAGRYAMLLERHVVKLRRGFIVNSQKQSRLTRGGTRKPSPTSQQLGGQIETPVEGRDHIGTDVLMNGTGGGGTNCSMNEADFLPFNEMSADDWLTLPFDPSMAPFIPGGTVGFSSLDGSALDFIWNLPLE